MLNSNGSFVCWKKFSRKGNFAKTYYRVTLESMSGNQQMLAGEKETIYSKSIHLSKETRVLNDFQGRKLYPILLYFFTQVRKKFFNNYPNLALYCVGTRA